MVRVASRQILPLWMFQGKNAKFKQIAIEKETVRLKDRYPKMN